MGLLDAMFGGGTSINLTLDTPTASPGSVVSGRIDLGGGKKPLVVKELSVRFLYVRVESVPGETLPKIETRDLARLVVAAAEPLPPGLQKQFTFRLTVPRDLPPSAHNVSFSVIASADIPGVKDPTAKVDVKVLEASKDKTRRLPLQDVLSRFPGLQSSDDVALQSALRDLHLACYSEAGELLEVEPLVSRLMFEKTGDVREKAISAWGNLVDKHTEPHHLQALYALANTPGLDADAFGEVIVAATKLADDGALGLVQQLAVHTSATIREKVASNLRFNAADKFNGKRELVVQLAQDPAPEVRKAAVGTLSCFRDDQQLMYWVANLSDQDPSAEVRAACISTLALAHYHGMGDLALAVYEKHIPDPDAEVRVSIARSLGSQPPAAIQRLWGIAQSLAADPQEQVRRALAFEFNNMEKLPQLLPIAQHMAQNDVSADVRKDALSGMSALMPAQQAAAFYGQLMAQARSEQEMWPLLNGLRHHRENSDVKRLLSQIGQCPFPDVADAARDALS
jgi:HEAT repeat protein